MHYSSPLLVAASLFLAASVAAADTPATPAVLKDSATPSPALSNTTVKPEAALERFEFQRPLMGTLFRIVLFAPDAETAQAASQAGFERIAALDNALSDYKQDSELSRLCRQPPGEPFVCGPDLFAALEASQDLAQLSGGAFDCTLGPQIKLWRSCRRSQTLPSFGALAWAKFCSGYDKLTLDRAARTATLRRSGMQLDLGGIGKGFANDRTMETLRRCGITRALVVAGGEMLAGEPPPGKPGWTIGLAPFHDPNDPPTEFILLANKAVSTSGDAEQYFDHAGVRYSHIVDPQTGLGLTGHNAVTIVASSGTLADGLATAVCVLGPKKGLALVEALPETAALVKRAAQDGAVLQYESSRWHAVPKPQPKP